MIWLLACSEPVPAVDADAVAIVDAPAEVPAPDPFAAFFDPAAVSGFGDPVGAGWKRLADDRWARSGFGDVLALAAGRVVSAEGAEIRVAHVLYENHHRVELTAIYEGLDALSVAEGAAVAAGEGLGLADDLRLRFEADAPEVLHLGDPRRFLDAHREVLVPAAEPRLALVSHDAYTMRFYEHGQPVGEYAVSFGQEAGRKERRGDNKSPKGAYFAVQRSRGPFDGPVGPFYGGIWVRIDYPNPWDAARGLEQGLIDAQEARAIDLAWRRRAATPKDTKLGGGIGFHAWAEEWPDDGPRHLSWGCIVVHVADRDAVYDFLEDGALVVLF